MYEKFKELDGTHPWREVSPDGYLDYQAHYRPKGRVLYFNFPLARELELIPVDHPPSINKDLEQTARLNAVEDIRRAARSSGILKDADDRARAQLKNFFQQLGLEVEFK